MMAPRRTWIIVACGALVAGCGDGDTAADAAVGDDAGQPDAAGCPARWTVNADDGASATIAGGALVLTATVMTAGSAIEVTQAGLSGDFDAAFVVTSFTAGGTGAFVQAGVSEDVVAPTRFLTAAIGTFPVVGVSAADQPSGPTDLDATAETGATLRFVRVGTTVTITAEAADVTSTVTATFDADDLRVGVQLGTNMGAIAPVTTATIDAFTLSGGAPGDAAADAFDCDSLIP